MLPEVDAIVAGEVREWESVEYARDLVAAGRKKALILIGRVLSEDPGMRVCADWLEDRGAGRAGATHRRRRSVLETDRMKAGEIVDRIKKHLGAPWRDATYRDTFKTGSADTEVTGIATTCFVTLDVIRKAAAARLNMIIPHEDTFWNDRDDQAVVAEDAVYKEKLALLTKHDIVVFRIHDHMHAQRPDFTYVGSARAIGLDPKHEDPPGSHRFVLPETTLGALAADVKRRSGARALRVVGDPKAKVSRIRLGVGYASPPINGADIDVLISGEQQESDGTFDSQPYALDAVAAGVAKGIILLGHTISEEAGMLEMAAWIKGFVPEVPVQLVKADEPMWSPPGR